jgi:hypothetical protein
VPTRIKIFWIKLTNWEYWPWQFVYLPIFVYWLWCGLKSKAIFWFSAANPGIEYGGIIGASKHDILALLPKHLVPKTVLVRAESRFEEIEELMAVSKLDFPVIIKPDIGERGFNVALLKKKQELIDYLSATKEDHLIQEYLDLPIELGIFYHRIPDEAKGTITSVVRKGMLMVTGDGQSTVLELMKQDTRALQQVDRLQREGKVELNRILANGEEFLLEPIGNHVRGTTFLNGNDLINQQLNQVFDKLGRQIEGFYYGRFDLRCENIGALYEGNFKVMEVNGAASEPAHIYSPNYPLLRGYKVLFKHWRILYRISMINHAKGVKYMSFRSGIRAYNKSRFKRA